MEYIAQLILAYVGVDDWTFSITIQHEDDSLGIMDAENTYSVFIYHTTRKHSYSHMMFKSFCKRYEIYWSSIGFCEENWERFDWFESGDLEDPFVVYSRQAKEGRIIECEQQIYWCIHKLPTLLQPFHPTVRHIGNNYIFIEGTSTLKGIRTYYISILEQLLYN